MEELFAEGFLNRSKDLYKLLACCVLQSVIRRKLEESGGAVLTRDALVHALGSVSDQEDRGTCNQFLSAHGNENLSAMIRHMDITVCCYYLLNTDGLHLSEAEIDAIHKVRKGRNLDSHEIDTGVTMEVQNKLLWSKNRASLLHLAETFPQYVEPDIKTQIEDYYKGTAGQYRPPASGLRERLRYALADGRPEPVLTQLVNAGEYNILREFSAKHEAAFLDYIDRGMRGDRTIGRERAWKLLEAVCRDTAVYAVRYAGELDPCQALPFLARCSTYSWMPYETLYRAAGEQLRRMPRRKDEEVQRVLEAVRLAGTQQPKWKEGLYRLLIETSPTPAQSRYWVRQGLADQCGSLLEDFTREQEQQLADLGAMNWVQPSPDMEELASRSGLPQSVQAFLQEKEREQVLSLLARSEQKTGKELCQDWCAYQSNPRIVQSKLPQVQEAVLALGGRVSRVYWLQCVNALKDCLTAPDREKCLGYIKQGWAQDENGQVICRPRYKYADHMFTDIPEYDLFRESWFRLREQYSRTYWLEECDRIQKAAALPFGPEKMAVAQDESYGPCMDQTSEEHGSYQAAWDAFAAQRSQEYWQWERKKLNDIRSQPYSRSRPQYVRDTSYDGVLVGGLDAERAWEAEYAQYHQEIYGARYRGEKDSLEARAAKWIALAEQVRTMVERAQEMANGIDLQKPELQALNDLERELEQLPPDCVGPGDAWEWIREQELRIKPRTDCTPEQQAFLDSEKDLWAAQERLDEVFKRRAHLLRDVVAQGKEQYRENQRQAEQKELRGRRAKQRSRMLLSMAAVIGCLAAVILGGRFLAVKAVQSIAGGRAANGQLVSAYELLDKAAFLGDTVEEQRRELLAELRLELLRRGYREERLSQVLTSNQKYLLKDAGLEDRTDITVIPSASVLVFQEEGSSGYQSLFHNKYPLEVRVPEGLALKTVWGDPTDPIRINALCTDGTVLRGELGWTFHTNAAEPSWYEREYAKIAQRGIDLYVDGHLDGVRMVLREREDGPALYWMEDGRVMEGERCLYRDVTGFLPNSYGQMEYYCPVLADGRLAISEDVKPPEGIAREDILEWEGMDIVLKDGRLCHTLNGGFEKGNDMLFDGLDVYSSAAKRWLEP